MKAAAIGGAMGTLASGQASMADEPTPSQSSVPTVTLGRTGQKVTILGMGTSWALSPSFVQAAIYSGVRYIDTSEVYENARAEKIIGEVLDRTKRRKDVYLVTKNTAYRKSMGTGVTKMFEHRLSASLERLKTDHVDCYYLHGLAGNQIELLRDPGVKAAFETLKQQGKTRFCGLSCHDARLPEILDTAAECGWIDQVMFKYNFRDVGGRDRHDELQRAIDKAAKANLGLIAMKTQGGAINFPDKMKQLQEKGFKKEVAAVKSVWMDGRIHVAVSEMTTRSDLRENVAASAEPAAVVAGAEAARRLPPDHGPSLLPRLRAPLRDRGPGRSGRHGSPLPSVLRGLRQTPRSPRALPGASAGRPRPRGRQPRRRCRRLSPRPARRRAHRTRGSADESLNRPA